MTKRKMTRRVLVRWMGVSGAISPLPHLFSVVPAAAGQSAAGVTGSERPNILIYCDDLGWSDTTGQRADAGLGGGEHNEAYSIESMVVMPYLLTVLRYSPQRATDIGKFPLNLASNMRWFCAQYMPKDSQNKQQMSAVPYERLSRTVNGRTPFATGDIGTHWSVCGGAQALWLGELVRPTSEDFILQFNGAKTDFLAKAAHLAYLCDNPWGNEREVTLDMGQGRRDVYEIVEHRMLQQRVQGSMRLRIPGSSARVVVLTPGKQAQYRQRSTHSGWCSRGLPA